jgi:hypothetical protein
MWVLLFVAGCAAPGGADEVEAPDEGMGSTAGEPVGLGVAGAGLEGMAGSTAEDMAGSASVAPTEGEPEPVEPDPAPVAGSGGAAGAVAGAGGMGGTMSTPSAGSGGSAGAGAGTGGTGGSAGSSGSSAAGQGGSAGVAAGTGGSGGSAAPEGALPANACGCNLAVGGPTIYSRDWCDPPAAGTTTIDGLHADDILECAEFMSVKFRAACCDVPRKIEAPATCRIASGRVYTCEQSPARLIDITWRKPSGAYADCLSPQQSICERGSPCTVSVWNTPGPQASGVCL